MKSKIITHIVLLIALSLLIILFGINGGWSVGLIAITLAVIIISCMIIPYWNTGSSFRPIRLEDLSSKEKRFYLFLPFLLGVGMALLLGSWGDRLRIVGAILMLLSGIIMRRIRKNLPPEE